jgi:hypothetical protein
VKPGCEAELEEMLFNDGDWKLNSPSMKPGTYSCPTVSWTVHQCSSPRRMDAPVKFAR